MRTHIDPFTLSLAAAIVLATFLPAQGAVAHVLDTASTASVALLFFLHGAALAREAVFAGATQWRLHVLVFLVTFGLFPLIVMPLGVFPEYLLPHDLYLGFLYLGALPSAVTSSIAFTAMARGNVPAAVCSAAASNVFGMMLTPFIVTLLMQYSGADLSIVEALRGILFKLLLPFAAGQAIRPWVAGLMTRAKKWTARYDQGVILLIVYTAFAQSVSSGLWRHLPLASLGMTILLCLVLLAFVLWLTSRISRRLGFPVRDEIAAVFCGSKKSLASGLPMAKILFAGVPGFGMIVLPIMFYNQIQIFVCAFLAQRYAKQVALQPVDAVSSV